MPHEPVQLVRDSDGKVRSYALQYHPFGSKSIAWDDNDNWWLNEGWLSRFAEYEGPGERWYGYPRLRNCSMFLAGKFDMGPVYVRHIPVYSDKYSTVLSAFLTVASPEMLEALQACEGIQPGSSRGTYKAHRDGIERLNVCKSVEFDAEDKPYALGLFMFRITNMPEVEWMANYISRPSRTPRKLKKFDGMPHLMTSEEVPF